MVDVPAPGDYTVVLDTGTLPDGVEVREASNSSFEVTVDAGEVQRVLFALAVIEDPRASDAGADEAADATADDDDGSTPWVPVAGALAIIGLGLGLVLWRRRSSGGTTSGRF